MPSLYHKNVEKGVFAFGKKYNKRFEKIYGGNVPLHINHPTKRLKPILYHPDVHFVTKMGKRHIFEILDSELRDENLIISDILLACLCPNTSHLVLIVPTGEDQDRVTDLAATITDNLISKGVSNKELPRVKAVFYISRSEAKTPEGVTEILVELLQKT